MASLLKAIVSDPTPLKYVGQAGIEVQSDSPMRAQPIRAELGAEHRCEYPELPKAAAFLCTQGGMLIAAVRRQGIAGAGEEIGGGWEVSR